MDFSFLSDSKFKKEVLIWIGAGILVYGTFVVYDAFFKESASLGMSVKEERVFGKRIETFQDSKKIIDQIRLDISNLNSELNNNFYSELKDYKITISDSDLKNNLGRVNPFLK